MKAPSLTKAVDARRQVVEVRAADHGEEGFDVRLSCGHVARWKVDPPTESAVCAECLDELVKRLRAGKGRS